MNEATGEAPGGRDAGPTTADAPSAERLPHAARAAYAALILLPPAPGDPITAHVIDGLRIAVVIPAFRAAHTLGACVQSVLSGARVPDAVVIVDDASTDGTPALGRALAAAHRGRVHFVALDRNRGPAFARNEGARAVAADAYFFLDADTELAADALGAFERRLSDADAVCGVYAAESLAQGAVPRYKALVDHLHFSQHGVVPYDGFMGACGGVRASVFRALGGFDESLRGGDDYENEDFGYRLAEAGHRNLLDPQIRARHHFPGFEKLTRTYFRRVSQWVRLFARRRRFESAGDATAGTGLATLAVPLMLACSAIAPLHPAAGGAALVFALLWLRGYGRLFAAIAKRAPRALPSCVVLNVWFSAVISAGAVHGALVHLLHGPSGVERETERRAQGVRDV